MNRSRWGPRALAPIAVLVALLGTWIGHTIEVLQLEWSTQATIDQLHLPPAMAAALTRQYSIAPFGGVHNYMAAVGIALLLVSCFLGMGLVQAWEWLGRRLDAARARLSLVFRNHTVAGMAPTPEVSLPSRLLALWVPLALVQTVLYVLQENIESAALGLPTPGLGVLTGARWTAPYVHAAVALAFTIAILALARLFRRRLNQVGGTERAVDVRRALICHTSSPRVRRAPSTHTPSLWELLGCNMWRRPPPPVHV